MASSTITSIYIEGIDRELVLESARQQVAERGDFSSDWAKTAIYGITDEVLSVYIVDIMHDKNIGIVEQVNINEDTVQVSFRAWFGSQESIDLRQELSNSETVDFEVEDQTWALKRVKIMVVDERDILRKRIRELEKLYQEEKNFRLGFDESCLPKAMED